jgi:hypothetical protein
MKLLRELNEDTSVFTEAKEDGDKNLYIEGIFLQSAIKNRNGRIYPEEIMDKEVSRYIKESIDSGTAYGELNHPQGPQINGDRISHRILSLTKEGKNYLGKAIVGRTVMGNNVRGIIEMGGKIGVSSRALGSVKVNKQGINEVQSDFRLCTAADVVTDPSAPDAWVNGIMENVEWFYDESIGIWKAAELAESVKKELKTMSLNDINERKLAMFESFVSSISKL